MVPPPWKVEVLASDMSYSGLVTAQQGLYNEAHMNGRLHLPSSLFRPARRQVMCETRPEEPQSNFDFHNLKADFPAAA